MNKKLVEFKSPVREYELVVVFKPFLPGKSDASSDSSFEEFLKGHGVKIDGKDVWGKRYLAYKIETQSEGYYILYNLRVVSNKLGKLKKDIERRREILRYLILRSDKKAIRS